MMRMQPSLGFADRPFQAEKTAAVAIELSDVSVTFGRGERAVPALAMTSVRIGDGEFVALVGPSGCGKSTILRLVAGLVQPSTGVVILGGREVAAKALRVGMAFQNPTMLPWLTIEQNIMLPLKIVEPYRSQFAKLKRTVFRDKANALLEQVGLKGFGRRFPWQLSGGMLQRANLCRALIHEPRMLLLDEPFGALDQFTREELWSILQELWMLHRPTVLLVTHDLREAGFLASRICVMSARPGRILDDREVTFARPRTVAMTFEPDFVALNQRLRAFIVGEHGAAKLMARLMASLMAAMPDLDYRQKAWSAGLIVLFFAGWELFCLMTGMSDLVLPRPSQIFVTLVQKFPLLWPHILQTLATTMIGFVLGVVLGVVLGAIIGVSKTAYDTAYPLLVGFSSIPKVALVPIFVLWFGSGSVPAVLTALSICFFPIVVNIATGLATTEPELEDVLKALGATKFDILWNVGLPRTMPFFFASLKVAISYAFVGAVLSETVASNRGIGNVMMTASSNFNVPLVFAGLFVLAALGVALYAIFAVIEGRVTGWATRKNDLITT